MVPIPSVQRQPADDVSIFIGERRFIADVSGALWWPARQTLVVADLHLEKGSAYARRGAFLPPYDSRTTLRRLSETITRREPERIILLGDSFHDVDAMHRLPESERSQLQVLQQQCDWIWITGNHDPDISSRLGGVVHDEMSDDGIDLRHEPATFETRNEIAGHLHPAARIIRHGRSIRRRCFIASETRLILPAFGAYAGGLNVCDKAFASVFHSLGTKAGPCVWLIGENGVYQVATSDLRSD